jgi:hypothetical protein
MSPFYMAPKKGPDGMNGTERRYATMLGARPDTMLVLFEGIKLRLARNTWYTPDFLLVRRVGQDKVAVEVHEVKGGWARDDARVKWKAVAEQHCRWATFVWAKEVRPGHWEVETYGQHGVLQPADGCVPAGIRGLPGA